MASLEGSVTPPLSGIRIYARAISHQSPLINQFAIPVITKGTPHSLIGRVANIIQTSISLHYPLLIQNPVPLTTSGTPRGLTERAASIIQPVIPLYSPPLMYSAIQRPNLQGILQGGSSKPKRYRDFPNPHIPLIKGVNK